MVALSLPIPTQVHLTQLLSGQMPSESIDLMVAAVISITAKHTRAPHSIGRPGVTVWGVGVSELLTHAFRIETRQALMPS